MNECSLPRKEFRSSPEDRVSVLDTGSQVNYDTLRHFIKFSAVQSEERWIGGVYCGQWRYQDIQNEQDWKYEVSFVCPRVYLFIYLVNYLGTVLRVERGHDMIQTQRWKKIAKICVEKQETKVRALNNDHVGESDKKTTRESRLGKALKAEQRS